MLDNIRPQFDRQDVEVHFFVEGLVNAISDNVQDKFLARNTRLKADSLSKSLAYCDFRIEENLEDLRKIKNTGTLNGQVIPASVVSTHEQIITNFNNRYVLAKTLIEDMLCQKVNNKQHKNQESTMGKSRVFEDDVM